MNGVRAARRTCARVRSHARKSAVHTNKHGRSACSLERVVAVPVASKTLGKKQFTAASAAASRLVANRRNKTFATWIYLPLTRVRVIRLLFRVTAGILRVRDLAITVTINVWRQGFGCCGER